MKHKKYILLSLLSLITATSFVVNVGAMKRKRKPNLTGQSNKHQPPAKKRKTMKRYKAQQGLSEFHSVYGHLVSKVKDQKKISEQKKEELIRRIVNKELDNNDNLLKNISRKDVFYTQNNKPSILLAILQNPAYKEHFDKPSIENIVKQIALYSSDKQNTLRKNRKMSNQQTPYKILSYCITTFPQHLAKATRTILQTHATNKNKHLFNQFKMLLKNTELEAIGNKLSNQPQNEIVPPPPPQTDYLDNLFTSENFEHELPTETPFGYQDFDENEQRDMFDALQALDEKLNTDQQYQQHEDDEQDENDNDDELSHFQYKLYELSHESDANIPDNWRY